MAMSSSGDVRSEARAEAERGNVQTGSAGRARPGRGPTRSGRRPADPLRRGPHRPGGAPGHPRARRRRVGARPADRAARGQHRRRRDGRGRAGQHALLLGPHRRGPRPRGVVPADHHGAVRRDGARGRPAAGPLPPRSSLRDRRDHAGPVLRDLGAGRRGRGKRALPLPRGVHLPRVVEGLRRDALGHRPAAAAAGLHAGRGQRADLAGGHRVRGARCRAGRAAGPGRPAVVAATRVRRVPRRDGPGAAAAAQGRLDGRRDAYDPLPGRHRPDPTADQRRAGGRHRVAGQRGGARVLGVPDDVPRVPAARETDRRARRHGSDRAWWRSARVWAARPAPRSERRCGPGRRRW